MAAADTIDGARAYKAATMASVLVLARPAGTEKYSTDEQIERAATIASGPQAFQTLWKEFISASTVPPEGERGEQSEDAEQSTDAQQPVDRKLRRTENGPVLGRPSK